MFDSVTSHELVNIDPTIHSSADENESLLLDSVTSDLHDCSSSLSQTGEVSTILHRTDSASSDSYDDNTPDNLP